MILDLRQFDSFPAYAEVIADVTQLTIDYDGLKKLNAATLQLTIQKAGEEYFCQGDLEANVTLECARCLAEYEEQISQPVDFIACTAGHHAEQEYEDNEDYALFQGADPIVDISDIVRQAIILSISMKPLCNENCKGLCAQCGVNLNETTCTCVKESVDPRWEALQKLAGSPAQQKE